MKTLILAAGYATRLYPLTKDRPKPLLDVAGRPVLEYILDRVEKISALNTLSIVVNHKFYPQFEKWKTRYHSPKTLSLLDDGSTQEENRLGAIGDIRFYLLAQKEADDLLVVAGDNLFNMDLVPFVQFAKKNSPFCSVMLYDVKDLSLARHYGIVGLDKAYRIVSFEEKPKQPRSTLCAIGVYFFPKKVLGSVEHYLKENSSRDAPGFFIRWLSQREAVYGYPSEGVWYDIGDLESYQCASQQFEKQRYQRRQHQARKEGM